MASAPHCTIDYPLNNNPADWPAVLVEYWFRNVCSVWSTFDSDVNFNRRVAMDTWTTSEVVFCTLQAMSNACLGDTAPHLRGMSSHLFQRAMHAIQKRMAAVRDSCYLQIDIDLVFAIFALGTSAHWVQQSMLGSVLLNDAEELLKHWKLNEEATATSTFLYASWAQALSYWRMLTVLVSCGPQSVPMGCTVIDHTEERNTTQRWRIGQPLARHEGTRPNAWCGLSCEVIEMLGQVFDLCRKHPMRWSTSGVAVRSLNASNEIASSTLAHEIWNILVTMDFEAMVYTDELRGYSLETHDANTPISHLIHTAEAYRRASLLHLYLTFQHLEIRPMQTSDNVFMAFENRSQKLAAFAIDLLKILSKIPIQSGSKCIQHVLYISAAAGLIIDKRSSIQTVSDYLHSSTMGMFEVYDTSDSRPQASLTTARFNSEVEKAREYVLSQMSLLQRMLPSRPIQIAKELAIAIWKRYDSEVTEGYRKHWLDIMADTGLQTLFR